MNRKNLISAGFLLLLAALTISAIFKGNDMAAVFAAMGTLHPAYLCAAAATAIFFVSAEGMALTTHLSPSEPRAPLKHSL